MKKSNYDLSKIAFKGELKFLSNMFSSAISIPASEPFLTLSKQLGIESEVSCLYASSEHFYQASKSLDPAWKVLVLSTDDGEKVKFFARKHLGKKYKMREDWDEVRVPIMEIAVFLKFFQSKELQKKLLSINGDIIEHNCWNDTFWGVCDGVGENRLGEILMTTRDFFGRGEEIEAFTLMDNKEEGDLIICREDVDNISLDLDNLRAYLDKEVHPLDYKVYSHLVDSVEVLQRVFE